MLYAIKNKDVQELQFTAIKTMPLFSIVIKHSTVLHLATLIIAPMLLSISSIQSRAQGVMGICTWIQGNSQPRKQSCTMQYSNSGSLTITTYKRNYVFMPYSSRGGYKYGNRIFQLHGALNADSTGETSFSLISTEANKQFRKLAFQSENP